MEASRPMTRPATAQPTAIPTTAPVLSPLPDVAAGAVGDGALVIWMSGMIEEVEVPEIGEVWSRLELDTGRFKDSCEAELLGELGAGLERAVGLWAAEELSGGDTVDVRCGCTVALDEPAMRPPSFVVVPAGVLAAAAVEVTESSAMSVAEGFGVERDTEVMPSVAFRESCTSRERFQNSDWD